jgi:two-component system response regulator NreC
LLVEDYQHGSVRTSHDTYEQLTPRERDVLKLVVEGYTTQKIADQLMVSPKTVEGHKTSLMAKLGVSNRIELVKYALRKGIIPF